MILKEAQAKRVMKTLSRVIMDPENKYVTDAHLILTVDTFAPSTGLVKEGKFDRLAVSRLSRKEIVENDRIETILSSHEYETVFARILIRIGDNLDMYADLNGGYKFFDENYLKPFDFPEIIKSETDKPRQLSYCPEHEFYIMPLFMQEVYKNKLTPLGRMLAIAGNGELFDKYREEF